MSIAPATDSHRLVFLLCTIPSLSLCLGERSHGLRSESPARRGSPLAGTASTVTAPTHNSRRWVFSEWTFGRKGHPERRV